jgi:hypothetical protein
VHDFLEALKQADVAWQKTKESPYIFRTSFEGKEIRLRLNDFPEEPLATVFIGDQKTDIHEFPGCWTLPRHRHEQ